MELYFEKPKNAVIKIDGNIIFEFPHVVSYKKPLVIEYLPVTSDFYPFTRLIKVKGGKVVTKKELSLTLYRHDLIGIGYLPKINNGCVIETLQKLSTPTINVALIRTNTYNVVFYDKSVKKIITLPDYVKFPKAELFNDKLVILALTVFDSRYFAVISLDDYEVKLSRTCDEIVANQDIILSEKTNDSIGRRINYTYNYFDLSLQSVTFTYENEENEKNTSLGRLFLEAYVSFDQDKINKYCVAPIPLTTLNEYFGDIVLITPPFDTSKTLIGYVTNNVTIVKSVDFTIKNDKIDNFNVE